MIIKKIKILFVGLLLNVFCVSAQSIAVNCDTISVGLVPDEITAKKIAEAIWLPIYGQKIKEQRPYKAKLLNDIWIVEGLVPLAYRENPDFRGGTAYIEIKKTNSKVIKVSHGR